MRVLVTGATGFLGSHTTAALVVAGHEVRVLARNPARVSPALDPHGVTCEVVVGDMTDPVAVAAAVSGCDAVIHAAAHVGVGGGALADDANLEGARAVIGAAIASEAPRIVYTSSVTVHMPCDRPMIALDSPLTEPVSPYGASKVAVERLVRAWQDQGHPVTTVVLGGIYGPQTLDFRTSFSAILAAAETMMLVPPGGTTIIDVRDAARLLTRLVEDHGENRVLAGGHFVSWAEWVATLGRALGRPVLSRSVTADELRTLARDLAAASQGSDEPPLLSEEAAMVMTAGVPVDDRATFERFGVELTPLDRTFADTVGFLRAVGRLPDR